jgi:hypothetical protein
MRQLISGLVAAVAVVAASTVPAMACGGGLFQGSCCGQAYVAPCAQPQVYVSPAPTYSYSGCSTGCGGWAYERLPDPVHQYYYVNQGPTYTGPGNFAPYPTYEEGALSAYEGGGYGYRAYRHRRYHYGYAPRSYGPRYGYREHTLRRYY